MFLPIIRTGRARTLARKSRNILQNICNVVETSVLDYLGFKREIK